jgi:hypothetical protein
MLLLQSKKYFLPCFFAWITALAVMVISCQKELNGDGFLPIDMATDLTIKMASSVSGFVTDQNEASVEGAAVQFGQYSTTTDKFGYFIIRNAMVVKNAAVLIVTKPGYFNAIKTYLAKEGKSAFFRIKLLPQIIAGNIDAAVGGTVTIAGGFSINLPASALVNAATNTAYTGSVKVSAQWIDPSANDFNRIMPGDLRGFDSLGLMRLLSIYSMAAIELTGSAHELLQLAPGKKATVNFPIPLVLNSSLPSSIPIWYFDEIIGLWKQAAIALKTGNNYTGECSHLSFIGCHVAAEKFIQFTANFVNGEGKPIANANIKLSYVNSPVWQAHLYTDSAGFVNGIIPANAQLVMEVFNDNLCTAPAFSKRLTTTTSAESFGVIKLNVNDVATTSGSFVNCNNPHASSGFVVLQNDHVNYRAEVSVDGAFNFNTVLCSGNSFASKFIAVDDAGVQRTNALSFTLASGNNSIGVLNTCGAVSPEFIHYTIDGINYTINPPADTMIQYFLPRTSTPAMQIFSINRQGAIPDSVNIYFSQPGIASGSSQALFGFYSTNLINPTGGISIANPIPVNITEFGAIGEFIAGNFTGNLTGPVPANLPYHITCSFRVRRNG